MKVVFIFLGLPHYYNYVLNRLNEVPGLEIINIIPYQSCISNTGVYETEDDISFRVVRLHEWSLIGKVRFLRGMTKFLLSERPNILVFSDAHLKGMWMHLPIRLCARLLGLKFILKTIPFELPTFSEFSRRSWFWARIYRRMFQFPDAHVNYIEKAFDLFETYGVSKNKIFITYNSPDTDRLFSIRRKIEKDGVHLTNYHKRRIIHVGRLISWKRVDLLLSAFVQVRRQFSDAELWVVGDGPERKALERLSVDLGVSTSTQFMGGIYDPYELGKTIMSCAVYVLAGMGGLSINDAMCFGRPIICSVADGTEKKLVRHGYNGYVFRAGDCDDLSAKIKSLFLDEILLRQMGINSTYIIENEMNIHTVIRGYLNAFRYVTKSVSI